MIACLDVHYEDLPACGACILIEDWTAATPVDEFVETFDEVEPFVPGEFYRRELPCLLSMLRMVPEDRLTTVMVDGFVWLGDESSPGLGGHLYRALGGSVPVVGVAKSWMSKAAPTAEVHRGESRRPLYVSAAGIDLEVACRNVESMYGKFRMPTILGRVDRLSRGLVEPIREPSDPEHRIVQSGP